jgi:ribosomal protein L13E
MHPEDSPDKCPECGCKIIVDDEVHGERRCSSCGLVTGKIYDISRTCVSEQEWGKRKFTKLRQKWESQKIRRFYKNIKEIEKIANELNLPSEVQHQLKKFFSVSYQKKYTKGRPFKITRLAILLKLVDVCIHLIIDKMEKARNKREFDELNKKRKRLEDIFSNLKRDYYEDYKKAVKSLNSYFFPRLRSETINLLKEIEKETGIAVKYYEFDLTKIDESGNHVFDESFHRLFKKTFVPLPSLDDDKEKELRISYAENIRNKGIVFAYECIRDLDINKRQLTKKGIVCACCYVIAEYYHDNLGFWLAPVSKTRWTNHFKIDRGTLESRIKEIEKTEFKRYRSIAISNVKF